MKILAFKIGTYHEKEREEFCPAAQCSKGQCSARFFGIVFFSCYSPEPNLEATVS
jgi:hypothetical protein